MFAEFIVSLMMVFSNTATDLITTPTKAEVRQERFAISQETPVPGYYWGGKEPLEASRLESTVKAVLERLPHIPNNGPWRALIIETAMAESSGGRFAIEGRSKGDMGVFQLREKTAKDTLVWLKDIHPDAHKAVMSFYDENSTLEFNLEHNVPFGTAMCATYYWRRDPKATLLLQVMRAKLWKEQYNTHLGKGTVQHYLESQK